MTGGRCLLALLCLLWYVTPVMAEEELEAVDAPIDVSKVQPEHCRRCLSSGSLPCTECNSSGVSLLASIVCPKCDGKKGSPCTRCADGKAKCRDCKSGSIDGKEMRVITNPEYRTWRREYGRYADQRLTKTPSGEVIPPAPPEFLVCPDCQGTGIRTCPVCKGTTVRPCDRCGGEGKVKGRGPCPACNGARRLACPDCGNAEGDVEGLSTLEEMRAAKLLEESEYFKRRRLLVAQELFRRKVRQQRQEKLEAQARQQEEERLKSEAAAAPAPAAANEAPTGPAPVDEDEATRIALEQELAERKERFGVLLQGFSDKVIRAAEYEEKMRQFALPPAVLKEMEAQKAEQCPRLRQLVDLREAFSAGRLTPEEYRQKRDGL